MIQVVDTFIFADELDVLECRLRTLGEVVDWFVLVESETTFTGDPKPLHYEANRERYAEWSDRIVHVVADLPSSPNPWVRERAQRESIIEGLRALPLSFDDTVVVSDVDEIWRPSIVVTDLPRPFTVIQQSMYVYDFGWRHPDPWFGPVVVHVEDLPPTEYGTFEIIRSCRLHERPPRVGNGGWHLSYFGGDEAMRRKQSSFSHTEFADVDLPGCRNDGLHVDGTQLERVTDLTDLPSWVAEGWLP